MLLGITHPGAGTSVIPNQGIDKAHISKLFEREGTSWTGKLPTVECCMVACMLHMILIHNLLQMLHKNAMTDYRAHLVASLMEGKPIDVPTIMCHIIL